MALVSGRSDHLSLSDGNLTVLERHELGMQVFDVYINSRSEVNAFGFQIDLPEYARFHSFDFGPLFSDWEFHGSNVVDHTLIVGGFEIDNSLTGKTLVGSLRIKSDAGDLSHTIEISDLVDDIANFTVK